MTDKEVVEFGVAWDAIGYSNLDQDGDRLVYAECRASGVLGVCNFTRNQWLSREPLGYRPNASPIGVSPRETKETR